MKTPKTFYTGMLLAFSLFGVAGCGSKSASQASAAAPPAASVTIQTVQSAEIQEASDYVATLKSRRSANISPQVDGQITKIFVKSGDYVKEGTPLLQIDPLKQQATVNSQESARASKLANLRYAEQQHERTKKLFAEGVVSRENLDQAQAAAESAQADLKALDANVREQETQLHYYKVVAPMSGIVGDIPVRVGDRVTTSTLLTTVDEPGALEAYIWVPIERSGDLRRNQKVQIVDNTGQVVANSHITFISPQVNDQAQAVLAKAEIDNKKNELRTAQFIRARVVWGTHQGPLIPVLAVSRVNGQFFAFTAESDNNTLKARQKMIHVGDMVGNDYAVLDGLKPGDRIVTSGTQFLFDGAPIKEAAPESPKS